MRIPFAWLLALVLLPWPAVAGPDGAEARIISVVHQPSSPKPGDLLVVEVRGGLAGDRISGTFLGTPLRFFIDRHQRIRALAAVPLECQPGPAALEIQVVPARGGDPLRHLTQVPVLAGAFGEQPLRVNPKFVKPPAKVQKRILAERVAMKKLWEASPTTRLWRGNFVWPRKDEITSAFGLKRMFNKDLASRHRGLDIDGRTGSPVHAIGAGRVVMVTDRYYSGGTVLVDHGLRLFSMYFHMSKTSVVVGQRVERGQRIGSVGRTGRSTGPHLHISTKVEGEAFDPIKLFEFDFKALDPAQAGKPQRSLASEYGP